MMLQKSVSEYQYLEAMASFRGADDFESLKEVVEDF